LVSIQKKAEKVEGNVYPKTIKWMTFEDKKGAYTRAVVSEKTEVTHLVFGIKYKNQKAYDAYKKTYMAFKQSLSQYAD